MNPSPNVRHKRQISGCEPSAIWSGRSPRTPDPRVDPRLKLDQQWNEHVSRSLIEQILQWHMAQSVSRAASRGQICWDSGSEAHLNHSQIPGT